MAGVASLALLLSLTGNAARACILSAAIPHDVVASELCPESGAGSSTSAGPDCFQERFMLQKATMDSTKVAALAAADFPPLAAHPDQPVFPDYAAAATASLPANTPPPPPHILYCRLRN